MDENNKKEKYCMINNAYKLVYTLMWFVFITILCFIFKDTGFVWLLIFWFMGVI